MTLLACSPPLPHSHKISITITSHHITNIPCKYRTVIYIISITNINTIKISISFITERVPSI